MHALTRLSSSLVLGSKKEPRKYFEAIILSIFISRPGSSAGCASAWYADGRGFDPPVRQHSFMKIGQKIISTAILPLPMIQVGQLSVTGERMYTE